MRHGFKGRGQGHGHHGRGRECSVHAEEHRGHHGRGPGGHRFRRGGRMFEQGDLRLLILKLIEEKPRHGYDLIKAIEERLGGMYAPSPGVVYPTLTLLEDMGQIEPVPGEGSKKLYALTNEGRDYLVANSEAVKATFARMKAAEAAFGGGAVAAHHPRDGEPKDGAAVEDGRGQPERRSGRRHRRRNRRRR